MFTQNSKYNILLFNHIIVHKPKNKSKIIIFKIKFIYFLYLYLNL